jgi:segregation and condensation protein A
VSDVAVSIEPPEEAVGEALLVLALDGYQGPIDLLLHLAKEQKVDLARLSMVRLAEQYITYIETAQELKLEVAADYLVMAAWLTYLKSRLLLPKQEQGKADEPTGEELAAALAWQMRRLEAMQKAAHDLMALPQLGLNSFTRGAPEGLRTITREQGSCEIYDLMAAYAAIRRRSDKPAALQMAPMELFSIEEAVARLRGSLGFMPEWTTLSSFLPQYNRANKLMGRSAVAATLIASLELAKQGLIDVRQDQRYGPIFLRRSHHAAAHLSVVPQYEEAAV